MSSELASQYRDLRRLRDEPEGLRRTRSQSLWNEGHRLRRAVILSAAAWAVRDLRSLSGERERSELLARKDTVELACREGLELQRGELERAELGRGCSENSIIRVDWCVVDRVPDSFSFKAGTDSFKA